MQLTEETLTTPDKRRLQLQQWLAQRYPNEDIRLLAMPGDASFRRYFRCCIAGESYVAMDSPPDLEDCRPFVSVAKRYQAHGLNVPAIIHSDVTRGFLLISDFGVRLLFNELLPENCDQYYQLALRELVKLQAIPASHRRHYPEFGASELRVELDNFTYWLLQVHLGLLLNDADMRLLHNAYDVLIQQACAQPQVCVHRDYHSRNLMLLPDGEMGLLDFQDAVWGPVTYDLVSLVKDCYIAWPDQQVTAWCRLFFDKLVATGIITDVEFSQFKQWCDLMALQRHLKAMFIFARKWHRDQCPDFLDDIPRTLRYALAESQCHPALTEFHQFLQTKVVPLIFQGTI